MICYVNSGSRFNKLSDLGREKGKSVAASITM